MVESQTLATGLLLGGLGFVFAATLVGSWLTRDRPVVSLLALIGAAGALNNEISLLLQPTSIGGSWFPDPRLHGWLAILSGHTFLFLGLAPGAGELTMRERVIRFRLPIVLAGGTLAFAVASFAPPHKLGSTVGIIFHAGLVLAVTYSAAMRRFLEGFRPAGLYVAGLLVLPAGLGLSALVVSRSEVSLDADLAVAAVLLLHLLLLGAAALAGPAFELRARLGRLEVEAAESKEARATADQLAAERLETATRMEAQFYARAAEIAALSQEAEQLRQQLDGSQRRLFAISEQVPEALLTFDGRSLVAVEANARAEEVLGVSRDELRGRPLRGFLAGASAEEDLKRLLEAPSGETLERPVRLARTGTSSASFEVTPVVARTRDRHWLHLFLRPAAVAAAAGDTAAPFLAASLAGRSDLVAIAGSGPEEILCWNSAAAAATRLPLAEARTLGAANALAKLADSPETADRLRRDAISAARGLPVPSATLVTRDGQRRTTVWLRLPSASGEAWLFLAVPAA